ncbi:MAG: MFS transporter [Flavobacterium sp.]|uniref:MFS transporter n=1 Tax=Flavobacterium sp. TaxID=239 RepID=UPI003263F8EC
MKITEPLKSLKEPLFAKLYLAQTISLLGDAFTWIGIALLAFEFGGNQSAKILATALTLRVTAFIIFGSYAGVLADRVNRKAIMIITNIARMFIVFSLAFVTDVWQLYVLIFLLNIFNAFFTPSYKACIPQLINNKENYANAITLSNATWQLLGILGPGLAGVLAIWLGSRQIFIFDAISFIISSILVFMIPISLLKKEDLIQSKSYIINTWNDIVKGTKLLFKNPPIRFALLIELVAAIAGAQILVNTVGHIKGDLLLTDREYGWAMTAFGVGATIAAFTSNILDKSKNKTTLLIVGALMLAIAVSLGNIVPFTILLVLWMIAGLGQSFTEMPSQILIAENIPLEAQGKVYGSHFAWSHLWWAIGYPIAGLTGIYCKGNEFLIGGLLTLGLLVLFWIFAKSKINL